MGDHLFYCGNSLHVLSFTPTVFVAYFVTERTIIRSAPCLIIIIVLHGQHTSLLGGLMYAGRRSDTSDVQNLSRMALVITGQSRAVT
jgi:hypothetical protein